jgi:hypothetical protein
MLVDHYFFYLTPIYKSADEQQAKNIEKAVWYLTYETKNPSLENLYDMTGKFPLKIKQNDLNSVKNLIEGMQSVVYYDNKAYGPYLDNGGGTPVGKYDYYRSQGSKSKKDGNPYVGYRIEI